MKLHSLEYWVCPCLDDRPAYSIRARTREEARRLRAQCGASRYAPPRRVTVVYRDSFDLILKALGEGGIEPHT